MQQPSLFEQDLEPSVSSMHCEQIALYRSRLRYFPAFYSPDSSQRLFAELLATSPWRQDSLVFGGKPIPVPRLQVWVGDQQAHYGYSGLTLRPEPWTPLLLQIKQRVEQDLGMAFNSVLLNLYRDGKDSVTWHSDDASELATNPQIASLSFGAQRRFELKPRRPETGKKHSLELRSGSLLLMGNGLQDHWLHQLPKDPGISAARINLTFRFIHAVA